MTLEEVFIRIVAGEEHGDEPGAGAHGLPAEEARA